ncbi:MAG: hypothetical protein ABR563_06980 [Pyrinomonadaceae bacterium]
MNSTSDFLFRQLQDAPSLLAALVCILIAAVRWRRHPAASLLTILGLGLLAVQTLFFNVLFFFAPERFAQLHVAPATFQTFNRLMFLSQNIIVTLALALLLTAVFVRRELPPRVA